MSDIQSLRASLRDTAIAKRSSLAKRTLSPEPDLASALRELTEVLKRMSEMLSVRKAEPMNFTVTEREADGKIKAFTSQPKNRGVS